jgi:hypothetical protein
MSQQITNGHWNIGGLMTVLVRKASTPSRLFEDFTTPHFSDLALYLVILL